MSEPLSGFTVVEMTIAVQGPAAGLYLRDMGATVLKIEPPLGDASRYGRGRQNEAPEDSMGPQYVATNRGKRSVCLDVGSEEGRHALENLLASADVFLTNYRAPALAKMGLDYTTLHERYPSLIYASVNGFGLAGKDADKAMLDGAAVARGGLASMTGPTDGAPCLPGAIIGDTAGAMHLALGVVTALLARERSTNQTLGQHVHTSALGTQLWLQQWELTHVSMNDAHLQRHGSHHPNILGPYGIYPTADGGAILLATTMTQEDWDRFCAFADVPELAIDPRLQTPAQRLGQGLSEEDSEEIRAMLREAFAQKTAAVWDEFLRTLPEVIWERVRTWPEVLQDEQSIANGYFTDVEVAGVGTCRTVGNLVNLSETPGSVKGNPPELGEANSEVLGALGLSAEQIAEIDAQAAKVREEAIAQLLAAVPDNG